MILSTNITSACFSIFLYPFVKWKKNSKNQFFHVFIICKERPPHSGSDLKLILELPATSTQFRICLGWFRLGRLWQKYKKKKNGKNDHFCRKISNFCWPFIAKRLVLHEGMTTIRQSQINCKVTPIDPMEHWTQLYFSIKLTSQYNTFICNFCLSKKTKKTKALFGASCH